MSEHIYYCTKPGEIEDLICALPSAITEDEKAKLFPLLKRDGYDINTFREFVFNWQMPNFGSTIQV